MAIHLVVSMLLLLLSCSKSTDPNDLPRIKLTAENVISKEVWLRVKFININEPREFVLERDGPEGRGKQIATGRTGKADTLVIDTTALPRTVYAYKAIQLEGRARTLESDVVQVQTLDTTSHAVQWQIDTLGVRGEIYDVWAFSRDNIWAVGEIYLRDSTGNQDPVKYNLARWNGQKWSIERVYYGQSLITFRAMYAFGESDVWVGGNTQPMHWNGSQWQKYDVPSTVFSAYIYKIWGTSSSNVIIVGTNGSIARFNGSTWQKMDSGTEVDLEDVWGIDEKHVWATGMRGDYSRSVILQHDGRQWSHIFDSYGKPRELDFRFQSVWTDNINIVYLAGLTGQHSFNIGTRSFRNFNIGQWASLRIRASAQNDIFIASYGSELLHYNGSTWRLYPEIKLLDDGYATWYTISLSKDLAVIGGYFFTGLYGVPVVLRGYR